MEDWIEYKRLILSQLKKLNETCLTLNSKVDALSTDITILKVKAGLYGAIAGAIPALLLKWLEKF